MSHHRNVSLCYRTSIHVLAVILGLTCVSPRMGGADEPERVPAIPGRPPSTPAAQQTFPAVKPVVQSADTNRLMVDADEFEYDGSMTYARGNVVITKGEDQLMADAVTLNRETHDAVATGHVVMRRGEVVMTSTNLTYNFKTRVGNAAQLAGDFGPYKIKAADTRREGETVYFEHAEVTTCTNCLGNEHFRIRARKIEATPGEILKARGCVLYLGPVPVFYTPYMYRNLNEDVGLRFVAGYGSHVGAFLLSSYRYHITEIVKGETHVDYRTKRGVAFGQDFRWKDSQGKYNGEIKTYYLKDDAPWDDDDDPVTSGIEEERYRVRFRNTYNFSPKDYSFIQADYLSDTDILEDFFEKEYRDSSQPDNFVSLTHKEENYSLTLLARSRLNDFYESVNRLPELSLDMPRMQLGDSIFYYEGEHAMAQLERVYPEDSGLQDYSAMRMDSMNTVYMPTKQFGFLNLTPRAGFRETYYTETPGTLYTNSVTVQTNADTTVTTNALTGVTAGDSLLRSSVHFGLETSYKAYKIWDGGDGPRRHIVEPYANYTLVPEPDALPAELYQFDEIDSWDEQHFIKLGTRQKYQRKGEKGGPEDIIDADIYTILELDPADDEDVLQNVYFDAEITPNQYAMFDFDGYYDTTESALQDFGARMILKDPGYIKSTTEYRFIRDDVSQISEDLTYYASERWAYNVFGRYSLEDSRAEEYGGGVQRTFDCISWKTGVTYRPEYDTDDGTQMDDEFRVMCELWVNAFDKERDDDDRYRN